MLGAGTQTWVSLQGARRGAYPHQLLAPSNLGSIHLPDNCWGLLRNEGVVQYAAGMQNAGDLTPATSSLHACSRFLCSSCVHPGKQPSPSLARCMEPRSDIPDGDALRCHVQGGDIGVSGAREHLSMMTDV